MLRWLWGASYGLPCIGKFSATRLCYLYTVTLLPRSNGVTIIFVNCAMHCDVFFTTKVVYLFSVTLRRNLNKHISASHYESWLPRYLETLIVAARYNGLYIFYVIHLIPGTLQVLVTWYDLWFFTTSTAADHCRPWSFMIPSWFLPCNFVFFNAFSFKNRL